MAKVWKRDGIKLTFLPGGKVGVEVDLAAVTAASELEPVGTVRVYEIDAKKLGRNIADEARRVVKKIRNAAKRRKQ